MKQGLVVAAIATAIVAVGVACSESLTPTDSLDWTTVAIRQADVSLDRPVRRLEARFKEIEDEVPGFAGFYGDVETGDLVMRLKDLGRTAQLQPYAEFEADRRPGSDGSRRSIRYEIADYSFSELRGFRGALWSHLRLRDDVTFVDIGEVENRMAVGISDYSAQAPILRLAEASGIPDGAVEFYRTSHFAPDRGTEEMWERAGLDDITGNLGDHQDSVIGGILVRVDGNLPCSAWIQAKDGTTEVAATASHCGGLFDLDTGDTLYQRNRTATHIMGPEWDDPDPWGNPLHRWADISLYKVTETDRWFKGWFAQTTNQAGSKTFHSTEPILPATGEISVPVVGDEMHKVGQATGWTKGALDRTNVDRPDWDGSNVDLLDQDIALYNRAGGDSGAPVVADTNGVWKIVGIHVGGVTMSGQDTAIFSSMWNIEQDVGNLNTLGPPLGPS